jgi:hypothetical protein
MRKGYIRTRELDSCYSETCWCIVSAKGEESVGGSLNFITRPCLQNTESTMKPQV